MHADSHRDRLAVHHDVAWVVDRFLEGEPLRPEIRERTPDGEVRIRQGEPSARPIPGAEDFRERAVRGRRKPRRIYTYGVSRSRLERAIRKFRVPAYVTTNLHEADLVLTLKSQEKRQPRKIRELKTKGVPVQVIRSNTVTQMENFLRTVFDVDDHLDGEEAALQEAEAAVAEIFEKEHPVELAPQNAYIRRLQHQLGERYGLATDSKGVEPYRQVVIYPP